MGFLRLLNDGGAPYAMLSYPETADFEENESRNRWTISSRIGMK